MGRSIAISSEIARRLRQEFWLPSEKLEVVYNGVQLQQFNRAADARKRAALVGDTPRPVILSVARYSQQKGLNYLIEAAARVPQAMFLLAGEGPERQSLELQANELGLHSRVLFLGYRNDIPDLLALCDLFVLPSVYEGMPIALIEAMGAGKPVIATDLPGCKELITHGENGWIIPAADSLTLADSIQMLLKIPWLAHRLGQAGQAYVRERLSMDIVTRRITQLYTELLVKPESVPGS